MREAGKQSKANLVWAGKISTRSQNQTNSSFLEEQLRPASMRTVNPVVSVSNLSLTRAMSQHTLSFETKFPPANFK
jgi:hypothetical protein